jgi:prevent-host-death family protein
VIVAKHKRMPGSAQGESSGGGARRSHSIQAAEFKATCLQLMDHVKRTGEEFVITKRNRPVAKLAPITDEDLRPFVGRSRGVITASREDLLAPVGEDWEVDADL